VEDPNGNRITATYAGDQLTALTHSAGQYLQVAGDGAGRIQRVTDQLGRETEFTYDGSGQLATVRAFDNRTTTYAYGPAGSPSTAHALTNVAFPDGSHRTFSYDAYGRLSGTSRDGGAEAVTFAYGTGGASRPWMPSGIQPLLL